AYVPTEIPEGYELCEEERSIVTYSLKYANGEKKIFYDQSKKEKATSLGISCEEVEMEKIHVIGEIGYYLSDGRFNSIFVEKGAYIFSVSGELSKKKLIDILDSVVQEK
ncbi:MAG: DUF4367 domain-containing protein, partial [Lachnospiraceae bacterium]